MIASQSDYTLNFTYTTPKGIHVDPGNQKFDLDFIDNLVDETENCLAETFGNPPVIPSEIRNYSNCIDKSFPIPIKRKCLYLKIVDDWEESCLAAGDQVLPILAPGHACMEKGLVPTKDCPCRWRTVVQDRLVIVTTPNLKLFKDSLIRITTGCNNPWIPEFKGCASVSKIFE
jgi:hypothetical protein